MKILHIDKNHPLMLSQLSAQGFENYEDYTSSKEIIRSEEHTSELQSHYDLVCRLLLEKKK